MEENKIVIEDSIETKKDFICRKGIEDALRGELDKADILILPKKDFREGVPFCVPECTREIFQFLKTELAKTDNSIDLAISDDEYTEIELHDVCVYLPDLYMNVILLPLAINLLSSWIYDKFSGNPATKEEPKVKITIIVATPKGNKRIKFEGDNKSFKQLMDKVKL